MMRETIESKAGEKDFDTDGATNDRYEEWVPFSDTCHYTILEKLISISSCEQSAKIDVPKNLISMANNIYRVSFYVI